ncbi:hypothetical protein GCM10009612_76590 [Streptomyces beijiangensis]
MWGWQQGLGPAPLTEAAGLTYGVVAALAATVLQAPLVDVVALSAKYTALTTVFSVWVAVAGAYAGWQLLRGRNVPRGAFA